MLTSDYTVRAGARWIRDSRVHPTNSRAGILRKPPRLKNLESRKENEKPGRKVPKILYPYKHFRIHLLKKTNGRDRNESKNRCESW